MPTYIKGNYRKSIYKSDKNYIIGLFKVRDTNDEALKDLINKTITFTGYFHELNEDDTYIFYGEYIEHPKYGFQYNVTEYERVKPEDKDGIIEFLSSDLFPGIGVKMAESIVEVLGENALDQILMDSNCLNLVPKLSTKKAKKIYEILQKYEESHKTIVYLSELGFNMKDSLNIYNFYKTNTINVIEHNIYRIIDEVEEISFLKVDEIAKKLGIAEDDGRRIKACILYVFKEITFKNGDTYLEYSDLYKNVCSYFNYYINDDDFFNYLKELVDEEKIIFDDNKYYLQQIWKDENIVIDKIKILINKPKTIYNNIEEELEQLQKENNIVYNYLQKKAIISSLQNNIQIITGGPGTGKTTIIKAIVNLYMRLNNLDYEQLIKEVALLAPTGRAAKRISESTNMPANTIHRFLKWNKETNQFGVNEYNKDYSKLFIIDEVSMIDICLLASLFRGINNNIKVILVGDHNQLPSVGPGQVLKDFIESDIINTVHLSHLYRQDENSYITKLAHEIKNNELSEGFLESKSDYTFLKCTSHSIKNNLSNICTQIINKGYDYKQLQIMAPMYAGINGIDNLNKELQNIFNPPDINKKELKYGDVVFREGDKILQLVNMPEDNVYNGDIGIISSIYTADTSENGKNEIYVDFDGNIVKYTSKDFNKIKHGYIISIHKSQGSEFEFVIIPLSMSYRRMLYRKLIYTAVTRAKRKLILLGEVEAFTYSIANNNEYIRKTNLLKRLVENA